MYKTITAFDLKVGDTLRAFGKISSITEVAPGFYGTRFLVTSITGADALVFGVDACSIRT